MIEQQANTLGQVVAPDAQDVLIGAPTAEEATTRPTRRGRATLAAVMRNRKAVVGVFILLGFAAMAIFAPAISPGDPNELVARRNLAPSAEH